MADKATKADKALGYVVRRPFELDGCEYQVDAKIKGATILGKLEEHDQFDYLKSTGAIVPAPAPAPAEPESATAEPPADDS